MAKCSLKKSPNGVYGGYSQESVEELESFVTTAFNEALMNAGDGSNGGLIKKQFEMHYIKLVISIL